MVVAGLFPTIKQQQTNWNNNNNNKENLPEMRNHLMTNQPTNQNQIPPLKQGVANGAIQKPSNFEGKILCLAWNNKVME